jgi:hypothetical protein
MLNRSSETEVRIFLAIGIGISGHNSRANRSRKGDAAYGFKFLSAGERPIKECPELSPMACRGRVAHNHWTLDRLPAGRSKHRLEAGYPFA